MDVLTESKTAFIPNKIGLKESTEVISLGQLVEDSAYPALIPIPFDTSVLLEYKNNDEVLNYLEYLALQIILSGWNTEFIIYDEDLTSEYLFLERLKVILDSQEVINSNIKILNSTSNIQDELDALWSLSLKRKSKILARNESWVDICQSNNSAKFDFKFVVLNNNVQLFELNNVDNLLSMIKSAHKFGIIFIILHNNDYILDDSLYTTRRYERNINLYQSIINLPSLKISYSTDVIAPVGDELYSKSFDTYYKFGGIRPNKLDYNIFENIASILEKKQSISTGDYEDYITIDVGSVENERFSLGFGQKSDVFNALLMGTRNSGKSTFLSHLIISMCEKYTPEEVKIFVHDSGGDSYLYEALPHIQIIDYKEGMEAIVSVINDFQAEFDRRIELINEARKEEDYEGEHNLHDYNKWLVSKNQKKLPVQFLIFDELSALLESLGKESRKAVRNFEELLSTFTKLYRKSGLMLILSSQSFDDFINPIKSNVRLRMSFKVTEKTDSDILFGRKNRVACELISENSHKQILINQDSGENINANRCVDLDKMNKSILAKRVKELLNSYNNTEEIFEYDAVETNEDFFEKIDLVESLPTYNLKFLNRYLSCLDGLIYQNQNNQKIEKLDRLLDEFQHVLQYMPVLKKQLNNDDFILQSNELGELLLDVDDIEIKLQKVNEILEILNSKKASQDFISNMLVHFSIQEFSDNIDETFEKMDNLPLYFPDWIFIDLKGNPIMPWESYQDGYFHHQKSQKCFIVTNEKIQFNEINSYIRKLNQSYSMSWKLAKTEDIEVLQHSMYKPELLSEDKFVWFNPNRYDEFFYAKNLHTYNELQAPSTYAQYALFVA